MKTITINGEDDVIRNIVKENRRRVSTGMILIKEELQDAQSVDPIDAQSVDPIDTKSVDPIDAKKVVATRQKRVYKKHE